MKKIELVKKKGTKYLMLGMLLAGGALATLNGTPVSAAEIPPKVIEFLNDEAEIQSGIVYKDATGIERKIIIPQSTQVKVYGTNNEVRFEFNGQKHRIMNPKELIIKNIYVSNKAPFYADSLTKVTLDGVTFVKGVDFSSMTMLKTLIIKNNSYFGDNGAAIHANPYLINLVMDNSTFVKSIRIYSNRMLSEAYVTNSLIQDDTTQYSNQPGYRTIFSNNRMERPKSGKANRTGGKSTKDIMYFNPQPEREIGNTGYIGSLMGKITYTDSNFNSTETIDVPAYLGVTKITDRKDRITLEFQNGLKIDLNNPKDLEFNNIYFRTKISFVSKNLRLEFLNFVNCKTEAIAVGNSATLQRFEMHGTEVSQRTGYVSVYDNKILSRFVMQDSSISGSSGYTSVSKNKMLQEFILNDNYYGGYVYTKDTGSALLQISNCQFNDYLSSTGVIEGEADRQWIEEL